MKGLVGCLDDPGRRPAQSVSTQMITFQTRLQSGDDDDGHYFRPAVTLKTLPYLLSLSVHALLLITSSSYYKGQKR